MRLLNILVPIKRCAQFQNPSCFSPLNNTFYRAVDYAVKIRVNPEQTGIDLNVKHSMVWHLPHTIKPLQLTPNYHRTRLMRLVRFAASGETLSDLVPAAVEEAVRIRERLKDAVKSIKVVTIGPPKSAETLRTALAMGADSAIHVEIPESAPAPEPLGVAKTLRALIERQKEGVDVVIMGKQAIDDDAGQTGQMLAGLLGWSQATFASKVVVDPEQKVANVTREIDGGLEELRCKLPVIITTDLR